MASNVPAVRVSCLRSQPSTPAPSGAIAQPCAGALDEADVEVRRMAPFSLSLFCFAHSVAALSQLRHQEEG